MDIYNYRLQNQGADLEEVLRHIFRQQRNAFKVNLAFGFISKNVETGEVRYFYPSQNGFVFDAPFLITDDVDLDAFLKKTGWSICANKSRMVNGPLRCSPTPPSMCTKSKTSPLALWETSCLDG